MMQKDSYRKIAKISLIVSTVTSALLFLVLVYSIYQYSTVSSSLSTTEAMVAIRESSNQTINTLTPIIIFIAIVLGANYILYRKGKYKISMILSVFVLAVFVLLSIFNIFFQPIISQQPQNTIPAPHFPTN